MVYYIDMKESNFLWDDLKNEQNLIKHKVGFEIAQYAFNNPKRVIARDRKHSTDDEQRFFCYGTVEGNISLPSGNAARSKPRARDALLVA